MTATHQQVVQQHASSHPLIDDRTFTSLEGYVNHLIHVRAYEEASRLAAGKDVLDVGCNMGYGVEVLQTTASRVAGIDVSSGAVKAANARLRGSADIRLYDGVRCSFASDSFDLVTSFQVIEHIADYDLYLSEIIRMLRADGIAIFTTPNAHLRLDPGMKPWNSFHVREFTPAEFRELLSKWFADVEVRGLFGDHDIYEVERRRLETARTAARLARPENVGSVREVVKRYLPWAAGIRTFLRENVFRPKKNSFELSQSHLQRFSTGNLFYRSDDLERSLDLMAVCHGPKKISM